MPALTAKESARYGVRLFGYLLVTTLLGGAFVGGGVALAYTMAPNIVPGGAAPTNYTAIAGGAVLALLGVLIVFSGIAVVIFTVIADGVRAGTGRRPTEPATPDTAEASAETEPDSEAEVDESTSEPDPAPETTPIGSASDEPTSEPDPAPETTPIGSANDEPSTAQSEPESEPTTPERSTPTDPFASAAESSEPSETVDPSDPIDDPHSATTNPFGEPEPATTEDEWTGKKPENEEYDQQRRAGPSEDDEAWREEIEAKLEEEDERETHPAGENN